MTNNSTDWLAKPTFEVLECILNWDYRQVTILVLHFCIFTFLKSSSPACRKWCRKPCGSINKQTNIKLNPGLVSVLRTYIRKISQNNGNIEFKFETVTSNLTSNFIKNIHGLLPSNIKTARFHGLLQSNIKTARFHGLLPSNIKTARFPGTAYFFSDIARFAGVKNLNTLIKQHTFYPTRVVKKGISQVYHLLLQVMHWYYKFHTSLVIVRH